MITRRTLFAALPFPFLAPIVLAPIAFASQRELPNLPIALNTGTIRGFNLSLENEIDVAAKAGYQGIEIWMQKVYPFLEKGGKLTDLKKRADDLGIKIINAISFPNWIVDDEQKRLASHELIKKEMEMLALLGCPCVAAPPAGATNKRIESIQACGERYRDILEIGDEFAVTPLLEIWGASATLSKLSDAVAIAVESEHPKASLLLDPYHLHRGGNSFESLKQISGKSLRIMHWNDFPAVSEREKLTDADRVYPGDGVAPLAEIKKSLLESGFNGFLSLELFNQSYWKNGTAESVAKTGYDKMTR